MRAVATERVAQECALGLMPSAALHAVCPSRALPWPLTSSCTKCLSRIPDR